MNTFRKLSFALLAVLVGALSLAACGTPAAPASTTDTPQHTIAVSGTGAVYAAPDLAVVQIGVQSRAGDPAQAVQENTRKMNAILAALQTLGVAAQDIQTTNFSVGAQQDYDPQTGQPRETVTYVVDNTVSVRVHDLNKLGEVLGKSVEAGANSIYGVSFTMQDMTALEKQARDLAMADAKARAEQLALAAGVSLGAPISISEYNGGPVPYTADMKGIGGGGGSVPVATGQIQVNLQVSITYLIK